MFELKGNLIYSPLNRPVNPFKYPIAEKLSSEFEKLKSRRPILEFKQGALPPDVKNAIFIN